MAPPKYLPLQEVPEFLLKMYTRLWIFFILGGLLGLACEKVHPKLGSFMVKNLILPQSSIKRANAQGIDTVVPVHKVQNF